MNYSYKLFLLTYLFKKKKILYNSVFFASMLANSRSKIAEMNEQVMYRWCIYDVYRISFNYVEMSNMKRKLIKKIRIIDNAIWKWFSTDQCKENSHTCVFFLCYFYFWSYYIYIFIVVTILLKYLHKSLSSCQVFSQHMLIKQLE